MKECLDSSRVNFLIWRYLIEGNYRETALKFQKEWHVEEPHRQLDFARHVKSHALVNVINKGLLYNSLEREFAQSRQPQDQQQQQQVPQDDASAAASAEAQLGIFGPIVTNPLPSTEQQQQKQQQRQQEHILQQQQQQPQGQGTAEAPNRQDEKTSTPAATATTAAIATPATPAAAAALAATATVATTEKTEESAVPAPAVPVATPGPDSENTRKRQVDRQQQQPPVLNGSPAAKRQRLSNGLDNGVDAATATTATATATATTPMEIDGQDSNNTAPSGTDIITSNNDSANSNHAYPSPLETEHAPTLVPRTKTNGPEQGTQVEKVEELATETTFVPLGPPDDNAPNAPNGSNNATSASGAPNAAASSPQAATSTITGESPVLLHCQWNPRDPTILAAAGTDALARIWTVSRGPPADSDAGHVNGVGGITPQFQSLIDNDVPPNATVTAMAWNWDGTAIAVATDSEFKGRLGLWSAGGSHLLNFEVSEPPIIKIRWNPNNTTILGIAPDNGGSLVTVFNAATSNTVSYHLPDHDLDSDPLDAAWTSETDFLLGGGELLVALRCTDEKIFEVRKFETRKGDRLTQIQFDHYDWKTALAATCGEKGFVDIWNANGKRREIEAHVDAVTALAWQPIPSSRPASTDERLLASGGEDGAIFIWNALALEGKPKCAMTMGPSIVALAFTPDGAFLAGATHERILIWKVGEHSVPRASWSRAPHPGWLSPRMNLESDEEDEHCLGWDSTGHKLAYGVNSRLAVINFR